MSRTDNYSSYAINVEEVDNLIPVLNDWVFLFASDYGSRNRTNVVRAYMQFMAEPEMKELPLPGVCVIGGIVHGHHAFKEGQKIVTSYIRKLTKVDESTPFYDLVKPGKNTIQLVAETSNDSLYCINYSERHSFMKNMESDFNKGKLSETTKIYVPAYCSRYDFL